MLRAAVVGLALTATALCGVGSAIPGILDGSGWDPPAITPR
jgi:hypothetical protein